MIGAEFLSGTGLGNQLWNYCVAKSVAEELDEEFFY